MSFHSTQIKIMHQEQLSTKLSSLSPTSREWHKTLLLRFAFSRVELCNPHSSHIRAQTHIHRPECKSVALEQHLDYHSQISPLALFAGICLCVCVFTLRNALMVKYKHTHTLTQMPSTDITRPVLWRVDFIAAGPLSSETSPWSSAHTLRMRRDIRRTALYKFNTM